MPYNPEVHKRRSIRLKGYDYSQEGLYFITICVHNRACLFGAIKNGEMVLNDAGKIAHQCWLDIPEHFPKVQLYEHVVMPNHVHGIIEFLGGTNVGTQDFLHLPDTTQSILRTHFLHLQNQFQKMIPRSIGSIVKGYKIGVTKWFRNNLADDFPPERSVWQRNYYEHIIRNQQSYKTIACYIMNNPAYWQEDTFYEKNIL